MEYEMTEERKAKIMEALKDSQEMATSKQLWVINTLCLQQQKEYALPLGKYEASLIISDLKLKEIL
tara:strand:- start:96 stop:293 length:198 start_codon:yes stop_codon:yes gene_type:complete